MDKSGKSDKKERFSLSVARMSEYDRKDNPAVMRTITVDIEFENGDKSSETTHVCQYPPPCNPNLDPLCG